MNPGYIYLMRMRSSADLDQCPCKIGRSRDAKVRQYQLGIVLPYDIEIIHVAPVNDMNAAEAFLHSVYEPYRLNGEWFSLPQEGIEAFQRYHSDGVYACGIAL